MIGKFRDIYIKPKAQLNFKSSI